MHPPSANSRIPGLTKSIFVVGEALVDVTIDAMGKEEHRPGGSPMNVAFGVARMGVAAKLLSTVGTDANGQRIRAHLQSAGVKLDELRVIPGINTSVARAEIGSDGGATYSFDLTWQIPGTAAVPADCGAIHVGSIGAILDPGADTVRDLFLEAPEGVLRSYDPNIRPSITPDRDRVLERVERLVSHAHLVKMSAEDADWLLPGADEETVARWALDRGVKLFVLTLGADGCVVRTPTHRLVQSAFVPSRVVDTIGAGDAFMSALLAGLARWGLLEAALTDSISVGDLGRLAELASRASSMTVAQVGAQPPTWAQVRSDS